MTYNEGFSSPAKPTLMVDPPLSSTMISFRVGITPARARSAGTADFASAENYPSALVFLEILVPYEL